MGKFPKTKMIPLFLILLAAAVVGVLVIGQVQDQKEDVRNIETVIVIETGPNTWVLEYHMRDGSVRQIRSVEALVCAADKD